MDWAGILRFCRLILRRITSPADTSRSPESAPLNYKAFKKLAYKTFQKYGFQPHGGKLQRCTDTTKEDIVVYKSRFSSEVLIDANIWYLRLGDGPATDTELDYHVSIRISRCVPNAQLSAVDPEKIASEEAATILLCNLAEQVETELFMPARDERNLLAIKQNEWARAAYYSPIIELPPS